MAKRTLPERLSDILEWGSRVAGHLEGIDKAKFELNLVLQDAVVRCLEVIGEAARHILQEDAGLAEALPDLKQAYWTRNRMAHGYYDINPAIVWETAAVSIPILVRDVRRLIEGQAS